MSFFAHIKAVNKNKVAEFYDLDVKEIKNVEERRHAYFVTFFHRRATWIKKECIVDNNLKYWMVDFIKNGMNKVDVWVDEDSCLFSDELNFTNLECALYAYGSYLGDKEIFIGDINGTILDSYVNKQ